MIFVLPLILMLPYSPSSFSKFNPEFHHTKAVYKYFLQKLKKNHKGRENLPAPVIMYFMNKILPVETIFM